MVPIVEMASSPRHIEEPLYLYEPAVPKDEGNRQERDSVISRILALMKNLYMASGCASGAVSDAQAS